MTVYIETGAAVAGVSTNYIMSLRTRLHDVEVFTEERPDIATRAGASSAKGGEEEKIQMQPQTELTKISLDLKTAGLVGALFVLLEFCSSALKTEAAGRPHASQAAP
jgi:hypothetical protein